MSNLDAHILTRLIVRLANVAGTQEPVYGPSAIKSVAEEADKTPYTELGRDGFRWQEMDSTCVETQVFYLMSDQGKLGMVQIIYSNVAYVLSDCFRFRWLSSVQRYPHFEPVQL